ncbi:hypothetical protein PC113_g14052 [Phytophthora cactorum]|uniref:non-specific serine/threonine protein kinase n=1 Tax=Phytophthora cactorum TaxID=29920 RepID=A0A8T0YLG5_9STRA|nr:hypothetical protein PC113_g14052 [Phytophthora cactorum]
MGGAASVDCTSNSNYRYGETPEVQASDDTSWIGTKLDMPLKPFSVENYFELLDIVGTGMLGKVRLVRHRRSSLYYILKSVKKKDVIVKRMIPQLEAERDAMAQMTAIRHPFSVQFFGSLATSSHVHFLLEYVPGGELFHRLHAPLQQLDIETDLQHGGSAAHGMVGSLHTGTARSSLQKQREVCQQSVSLWLLTSSGEKQEGAP